MTLCPRCRTGRMFRDDLDGDLYCMSCAHRIYNRPAHWDKETLPPVPVRPRDIEVARLLADGASRDAIAEMVGISRGTVGNIITRFGLNEHKRRSRGPSHAGVKY